MTRGDAPTVLAAACISFSTSVRLLRAAMMIVSAPALANEIAVARPMPLEAPVMKTVRPL